MDLAPVTDPGVVPVTVARAVGLPDQPGRFTIDALLRFVRDRQMLLVQDNCEHLLDADGKEVGQQRLADRIDPVLVSNSMSRGCLARARVAVGSSATVNSR